MLSLKIVFYSTKLSLLLFVCARGGYFSFGENVFSNLVSAR